MRRNTSRRAYQAAEAAETNGEIVPTSPPEVGNDAPIISQTTVDTVPMPGSASAKKNPASVKRIRKQTKEKEAPRSRGKTAKPWKTTKRRSEARSEEIAREEASKNDAVPQEALPPRPSWSREDAKENSGQPRVLIVRETLVKPSGEPESTEYYRILVQDRFDTAFSEPFAHEEVIGKSPADIIKMAEGISGCAQNIIGYARDRMNGIWLNHEFYPWSVEE